MSWFRHHYICESCDGSWLGEAVLMVESDCPFCGVRDHFPYKSDDWSLVVEPARGKFVVLETVKSARHPPDYRRRKSFRTRAQAEAFVRGRLRRAG